MGVEGYQLYVCRGSYTYLLYPEKARKVLANALTLEEIRTRPTSGFSVLVTCNTLALDEEAHMTMCTTSTLSQSKTNQEVQSQFAMEKDSLKDQLSVTRSYLLALGNHLCLVVEA